MNINSTLKGLAAACGLISTGLVSAAAHADVFVIANPSTPIEAGDIKDIFKGEKQFSGSTKLIPIDNGPAQDAFLSSVMRMDAARYNTIWTKKSFREGLNPPSVKSGDNDVVEFVRKTPGAVGYTGSQPSGVTVIQKY